MSNQSFGLVPLLAGENQYTGASSAWCNQARVDQTRAMPNRWINCDCGWGWALRKDVKEGWSTHCECCGRKWEKLLAKRQLPNPAGSARQAYNTQEDWHRWEAQAWEQTMRKPKKQPAWPPGLGWGRSQLTPGEYEDAVASLWKDADPQAQQVLRACGIEPPNDEEPDPRTAASLSGSI